jgi:2-dehydro-3-deoxygalactonokinase
MTAQSRSDYFLSCDWGTSAFRLHWAEGTSGRSLASVSSTDGINAVYQAWQTAGAGPDREERFLTVLRGQIGALERVAARPLCDLPLVISGMVTASIGLREIPHQEMPFALDGRDLRVELLAPQPAGLGPVLLVSGARTATDVMRGEEIQVVGAAALGATRPALFILPGTHSKHVDVESDRATGLRTFMTGEFFELLARRSILANSVEENATEDPAFADGVLAGAAENLLHVGFGVRVEELSGRRSRAAGWHYLSGLVIGTELRELRSRPDRPIVLVGSPALTARYAGALRTLGHAGTIESFSAVTAVLAGQRLMALRAGLLA